jgi:hypothetical protein
MRVKPLLVVVAVTLLVLPAAAQARPAFHGANNFYFWRTDGSAVYQSVDLGSNVVRLGINWAGLERGPGQPRFEATQTPSGGSCANWPVYPGFPSCTDVLQGLDDRVDQYSANGVTPLLSVGGTPAGWRKSECATDDGCVPEDPGTYGSFVQQLALRYALRGTPVFIEVGNEPDAFLYQFPNSPMPSYCASGTVNRTACEYSRLVTAAKWVLASDTRTSSTRLLAGALASPTGNWTLASQWITDMIRNGAIQASTGLSYHYYPNTSNNDAAALLSVDMLVNKIRPILHFSNLDSKEIWITEFARNPGPNNLLDEAADADFYTKVLPALDRATYDVGGGNSIKALQGITPYQIHDDSSCSGNPAHDWCSTGLYRSPPPILDIKPSGSVVKFLYHSSGTW